MGRSKLFKHGNRPINVKRLLVSLDRLKKVKNPLLFLDLPLTSWQLSQIAHLIIKSAQSSPSRVSLINPQNSNLDPQSQRIKDLN